MLDDKKVSARTVQLYRSALKFLYVKTLRRPWFDEEVARIKQRVQLPTVLSAEEIARILDWVANLKHWTLIATLYATGLRVSELRRLKVSDVDSQRMLIHVRQGKGRIARDIGLSPVLLERLRIYWRRDKPEDWLFPSGQRPHLPLDDRTIRRICRKAARGAGVTKRVSLTFSGIAARRICRRRARTCAPFRFCWAMRAFRRPPDTCAYRPRRCEPSPARSSRGRGTGCWKLTA